MSTVPLEPVSGRGSVVLPFSMLGLWRYAAVMISSLEARLARPGMPPRWAHEPNATSSLLFWRSSLAMCSFSELRTAPSKIVRSSSPSSIASTSAYLPSTAIGQRRMSAAAATSRMNSLVSRTATSQPPQAAPQ